MYNPLMSSVVESEVSVSHNRSEIELKVDTSDSYENESLNFEKGIVGSIDLFDFTGPNETNLNRNYTHGDPSKYKVKNNNL